MRTKTKYRQNNNSGQNIPVESPVEETPEPNIPEIKLDGVAAEPVAAISVEAGADVEPEAVAHAIEVAAKADDAALALKRQVEQLRASEELQRQQAAQMAAQRPPTREEKLALWKQQGGMHEAELKFLEANPELIDLPQLTALAANEAQQQGHERGSEEHMRATKEIFDQHLAQLRAQAEMKQPTPEFFRPPPAPPAPGPRSAASYVSAPVSREVPTSIPRELRPGQINLSAAEVEHARVAGVDLKTYARHKIELERQKQAGLRQNG